MLSIPNIEKYRAKYVFGRIGALRTHDAVAFFIREARVPSVAVETGWRTPIKGATPVDTYPIWLITCLNLAEVKRCMAEPAFALVAQLAAENQIGRFGMVVLGMFPL